MYMIQIDTYFLKKFQCATILIHVFCKNCEHEIVLQECKSKPKTISTLTKQVNNQTNCRTALEKWKKI